MFDFELLWMSSQLIVQRSYIIYFHIQDPLLATFCTSCWKRVHYFKRNCKSARFVCFDHWLRRYQNIYPLTKHHCIIERVYFIYSLFIFFISTFSFLLFLYTVSCRYKKDYLHTSIDILFKLCSILFILLTWWRNIRLLYRLRTYDTNSHSAICRYTSDLLYLKPFFWMFNLLRNTWSLH